MPRVVPSCRHTGLVTDDGELSWRERQRRGQVQARQEIRDQHVENARRLGDLSDREIAMRWAKTPEAQMHMQSRVRASVESLTSELVKFRKSSDKASDRLVWLSALV